MYEEITYHPLSEHLEGLLHIEVPSDEESDDLVRVQVLLLCFHSLYLLVYIDSAELMDLIISLI